MNTIVGFAFDRVLIYATGGGMVADVGAGVSNPLNTPPNFTDAILFTGKTNMQTGWTLGGGVEVAVVAHRPDELVHVAVEVGELHREPVRLAGRGGPPEPGRT